MSCGDGSSGPVWSNDPSSIILRSGDFTMHAKTGGTWAQGGCVNVTIYNTGVGYEDWAAHLTLSRPVTNFTDATVGSLLVDFDALANQVNATRMDGKPLLKSAQEQFFYCTEPLALPKAFAVSGTPVQGGGGTGGVKPPFVLKDPPTEDQTGVGLMMTPLGYQLNGGDCYKLAIRNFDAAKKTITSFELRFSQPVVLTEAQGGLGMGWPFDDGTRYSFSVPDWMGALPAGGTSPSSPSICYSPAIEPVQVDFKP